MKFSVPWSVKGIRPEARETAKEAARRSGMSLGDWLNSVILRQAEEHGVRSSAYDRDDEESYGDDISSVHERLDDITRRIDQFARTGPAAYAPKQSRQEHSRGESDRLAQLIARLDHRLDQFANAPRMIPPHMAPPLVAPAMPAVQLPPGLDRAVAEIAARRAALNGEPAPATMPPQQPHPAMVPAAPVLVPVPSQDLSGLEEHLRQITDQIETLRRPGVEEAINALRDELGEIGRALNEAMPRRAIDTIERQIQGLTQRIAEGRQAGVDGGALSGIEHGLAEVRDALRGLTPAENLVGFNEAVNSLAHKIDLIVAQKDPATLGQLEHAITTLREMVTHVASGEAISQLAGQVQMLGDKVEHFVSTGGATDALNNLEHRIAALADALAERTQNGGAVPPRLEALVQSLSDKIEQVQQSRGDNVAVGHLEDRIVSLVERLDASDSRLGHLEAIERGLADLLVHIEEMRANKGTGGLREETSPSVVELKQDIARTQNALEAVHGTLGHVVDRLASIERGVRGEAPAGSATDNDEQAPIRRPAGRVAARVVSDSPPPAAGPRLMPEPEPAPPPVEVTPSPPPPAAPPPAAAPKRLPPAARLPINPDLPPDQPLEPGSGPPPLHANPAARIAASEAALGGTRPMGASPGGKSGFIAAARRAAQAAVDSAPRTPRFDDAAPDAAEGPKSLRESVIKRMKSLFVAASIIAVVVGSIQIMSNVADFGGPETPAVQNAQGPDTDAGTPPKSAASIEPAPPAAIATDMLGAPGLPGYLSPSPGANIAANTPPAGLNSQLHDFPSLLNPPVLNPPAPGSGGDVTGSIARTAGKPKPPRPTLQNTQLPIAIGGQRLRDAATAGDAAAAYEVAVRFAEGRGVAASAESAAHWYERAASKGLAPAQFRYGSLLEKGQGVKKDLGHARRLYLAAATKGHAKSMHNLAVLYAEGIDGKPDYATAARWFRKAAQHGIADSQYNLGVLCARGLGTQKDMAESYKWFALAADQGDREAGRKRDDVAGHLDAAGLAAAQQAVRSFTATPQPHEATTVAAPPGGWDNATSAPLQIHQKPRGPRALSANNFVAGKR